MENSKTKLNCNVCQESILEDPPKPDTEEPAAKKSKSCQSVACCPPCGHIVHRACLQHWFNESKKGATNSRAKVDANKGPCPICRKVITHAQIRPAYFQGEETSDLGSASSSLELKKDKKGAINQIRDQFEEWTNAKTSAERKMLTELIMTRMFTFEEKFPEEKKADCSRDDEDVDDDGNHSSDSEADDDEEKDGNGNSSKDGTDSSSSEDETW